MKIMKWQQHWPPKSTGSSYFIIILPTIRGDHNWWWVGTKPTLPPVQNQTSGGQTLPCLFEATDWHLEIEFGDGCSPTLGPIRLDPGSVVVMKMSMWRFPKIGVPLNHPKSSVLMGFSIINHPFWGYGYPHLWKTPCISQGAEVS